MKFAMNFLFLLFTVLILTNTAYAESPREQLKQMVEQLRTNPTDDALREKIIKLAREFKPAPAIPEEADRRMARGTAAFKGAKSVADYRDAAKEFEQATLAAPWYGDAYFNLGVAQDKAENYEAALRSLKLAQLASPEVKEIKALIYEVEYRKERASSPEAQAAKRKQQEQDERRAMEEMILGLEGAIYAVNDDSTEWRRRFNREHFLRIRGGRVEDVDSQTTTNDQHYLCAGKNNDPNNNGQPEPIGVEMVCNRSSPFTGRIAIDNGTDTQFEISTDGRVIIWRGVGDSARYDRR